MVVGLRNSEQVSVTTTLPDSVSMTKFTEPLLDTPQTVAVVPQFVLKDQQNRTLMDAVRNVPGISIAAGESGAQGDNLTIRGFTARNDIFLDGIRDFGSYYRDSFNFEQVEVLEGPAGVQFRPGGTDPFRQCRLDIHVDVFQIGSEGEPILIDFFFDSFQA